MKPYSVTGGQLEPKRCGSKRCLPGSLSVALTLMLFTCSSQSSPGETPTASTAPSALGVTSSEATGSLSGQENPQESVQDLSDCKSEVIPLPPDFAPTMPAGGELLWFAPGMFEPEAAGYFRYAFRLDFEKPQLNTLASLEQLLLIYYEGLMSAVAKGKKREHASATTRVTVVASDLSEFPQGCTSSGCVSPGQFFEATIETIDEFATQKPITLKLLISATPNIVVVSVLPQATWQGETVVFGKGQGPAEKHLLPLGCMPRPANAP